jgi:hypothetical protein
MGAALPWIEIDRKFTLYTLLTFMTIVAITLVLISQLFQ